MTLDSVTAAFTIALHHFFCQDQEILISSHIHHVIVLKQPEDGSLMENGTINLWIPAAETRSNVRRQGALRNCLQSVSLTRLIKQVGTPPRLLQSENDKTVKEVIKKKTPLASCLFATRFCLAVNFH